MGGGGSKRWFNAQLSFRPHPCPYDTWLIVKYTHYLHNIHLITRFCDTLG
jgi:hypothetical protein